MRWENNHQSSPYLSRIRLRQLFELFALDKSKPLRWLLPLMLLILTGCESLGYYHQAITGHLSLISQRKPISHFLRSPETSAELQKQLQKVMAIRTFAEQQLGLPVNNQYSSYVALKRDYVVWNVFAAPELSLSAKTWCYPIVGCANYRGYYDKKDAEKYASRLQRQKYDVYVAGIAAYSTLGWFKDPVLSSFINRSDAELANLLFHELAHQVVYIKNDTVFNESFATLVAREGVRRWMQARQAPEAYQRFIADQQRQQQFINLVSEYRQQLQTIYDSSLEEDQKRTQKAQLIARLRTAHGHLKQQWGGQSDYDHWINRDINNAQLNTVATYFELVPAFESLLEQQEGNLEKFYSACKALAVKNEAERQKLIRNLLHRT